MGKTSLFGRRASKAPSDRGSPTNSQGSGGGEEKKKKSSRDKTLQFKSKSKVVRSIITSRHVTVNLMDLREIQT